MSDTNDIKDFYRENEFCQFWIDEHGIIHEIFKSSFDILTLDIAKIITKERLEVSNGINRPIYVELGDAVKMDREANKYLSEGESMLYLNATGILVRDRVEKLGASLYTKFFRPSIPTKFFVKKDNAFLWLKQHTNENQN